MFELSQDLGNSLSLSETLSLLSMRLRRLIPYDSIAVFVNRNGWLLPELVSGENFRMLSSLKIRVGEGLCGWVAENCKPIVNGNPQVEAGYVVDQEKHTTLQSALAVPLEGLNDVVGVLAMYHSEPRRVHPGPFENSAGGGVEGGALGGKHFEVSAGREFRNHGLSDGLPNARSLFMHLAQELARCRRNKAALAVLVCDVDGFKQINDSFGHLEGDKLLREFSVRLKDACRGYDYVARMGGDEFVIMAPGLIPRRRSRKSRAPESGGDRSWTPAHLWARDDFIERRYGILSGRRITTSSALLAEADRRMYSVKHIHHAQPRLP
jgi:GGDEF domain-containing protein/putative methionine-R-sulfoxide reductase with GAF domain